MQSRAKTVNTWTEPFKNYLFSRWFWLALVTSVAILVAVQVAPQLYPLLPFVTCLFIFTTFYLWSEKGVTRPFREFKLDLPVDDPVKETALLLVLAGFLRHSSYDPCKKFPLPVAAKKDLSSPVIEVCGLLEEELEMLGQVSRQGVEYYFLRPEIQLLTRFLKDPANWLAIDEIVQSEDDWNALHEIMKKNLVSRGTVHGKDVFFLSKNPEVPNWTYYTAKALSLLDQQEGIEEEDEEGA
ncbi:MAG: hypothetical protein ACFFD4_16610 [Candidatus Odinarchaeota archaeon]